MAISSRFWFCSPRINALLVSDRIAEAQGDDDSDDEEERGNKRKTRKRKVKAKSNADKQQEVKKSTSGSAEKKSDNSNLNVLQMMSDLVETPCDTEGAPRKRKLATVEVPKINFSKNSIGASTSRPKDEQKSKNSAMKTRKKGVCSPPDVALLSRLRSKKSNSKRLQRMKLKEALKKKLGEDEQHTTNTRTAKKLSSATSLVSKNKSSERATNTVNKKTLKKVKGPKTTPKKVSFEMSKIQVI